jgi:hypothetical protein
VTLQTWDSEAHFIASVCHTEEKEACVSILSQRYHTEIGGEIWEKCHACTIPWIWRLVSRLENPDARRPRLEHVMKWTALSEGANSTEIHDLFPICYFRTNHASKQDRFSKSSSVDSKNITHLHLLPRNKGLDHWRTLGFELLRCYFHSSKLQSTVGGNLTLGEG